MLIAIFILLFIIAFPHFSGVLIGGAIVLAVAVALLAGAAYFIAETPGETLILIAVVIAWIAYVDWKERG